MPLHQNPQMLVNRHIARVNGDPQNTRERWINTAINGEHNNLPPSTRARCVSNSKPFALIPLVGVTIAVIPKPAGVSKQHITRVNGSTKHTGALDQHPAINGKRNKGVMTSTKSAV